MDRPIREIKGCVHEYWSDEGIPDETVPDTPEQTTAADTVPGSQSMPIHHFFRIYNDVVTPVGLIDQGGCELQLDPVVDGKAQLALVATVIGLGRCSDTTSIWVKPGLPSRLWLSWKPAGDKCVVKISRMALRQTRSPAR